MTDPKVAAAAVKASESKDNGGNGGGSKVNPIYVTDPKDPRLKAYNDSLNIYNASIKYRNLRLGNNKFREYNRVDGERIMDNTSRQYGGLHHIGGYQNIYNDMVQDPTLRDKDNLPLIYYIKPNGYGITDDGFGAYPIYEKPKQEVILKEREVIKPITSGVKRAENVAFPTYEEELKPMTRTPIIKEALRKIVNPDFRDTDYTEKHNSVVDALGNPKYKYYNKDKVISEKEYKKLKTNEQGK